SAIVKRGNSLARHSSLPSLRPVGGQREFATNVNLGIEVNVDFVEVQNDLARREVINQPLNRSQSPRPTGSRPGAVDSWFGPIHPNPQLSQEPTHSGDADANSCSLSEHQNEQFLCPRRTPVAVHLRRAFNEPKQLRAVGIGDLIFPIVFSPVSESHRAML